MPFRIAIALGVLTVLSACAARGPLSVTPPQALGPDLVTRSVFVATSRVNEGPLDFGTERAETDSFARFDVAIPPNREPGTFRVSEPPVNPKTDFTVSAVADLGDLNGLKRGVTRALRERPRGDREVIIYSHGFNNSFTEGLLRITQLSHDLDLEAVSVHYSWPSGANPLGYGYDRDSVLFARDGLEDVIRTMQGVGAERVILVAHSVGSLLAMEALRQIAITDPSAPSRMIDGVFLISPDIDLDVFRSQAGRMDPLPEPFAIFTSQKDRALALSARLTGQSVRLGNLSNPEALAEFNVALIDVTSFSTGLGHFTPGTSEVLLQFLGRLSDIDAAFSRDRAGRAGLLPGTVLTVQNATQVILSPASVLAQ